MIEPGFLMLLGAICGAAVAWCATYHHMADALDAAEERGKQKELAVSQLDYALGARDAIASERDEWRAKYQQLFKLVDEFNEGWYRLGDRECEDDE